MATSGRPEEERKDSSPTLAGIMTEHFARLREVHGANLDVLSYVGLMQGLRKKLDKSGLTRPSAVAIDGSDLYSPGTVAAQDGVSFVESAESHFGRSIADLDRKRELETMGFPAVYLANARMLGRSGLVIERANTFVAQIGAARDGIIVASPEVDVLVISDAVKLESWASGPVEVWHHAATPIIDLSDSDVTFTPYDANPLTLTDKRYAAELHERRSVIADCVERIFAGEDITAAPDYLALMKASTTILGRGTRL